MRAAATTIYVVALLVISVERSRSFQPSASDGGAASRSTSSSPRRKFSGTPPPSNDANALSSPLFRSAALLSETNHNRVGPHNAVSRDDHGGPAQPRTRKRDAVLSLARRVLALRRIASVRAKIADAGRDLVRRVKGTGAATLVVNLLLLGYLVKGGLPSSSPSDGGNAASPSAAASAAAAVEIPYSRFLNMIEGRDDSNNKGTVLVDTVSIESNTGRMSYRVLRGETRAQRVALREAKKGGDISDAIRAEGEKAYTHLIDGSATAELLKHLRDNNIHFKAAAASSASSSSSSATEVSKEKVAEDNSLFPTLAFSALAYRLYQNNGGGGPSLSSTGPGTFAKKKKKGGNTDTPSTSFDDIEGADSAKRDVMELVDSLRHPQKYALVGARAPTGLLLEGPPGTGKTTLARAAANSADVPLIYCSGSDFVEKFAGTGAARVRKLFGKAQKVGGPCIVFIDEIDAVGKKRRGGDAGGSGASDEAEQTLNALLTCMDGLDSGGPDGTTNTICVLGATNRRDALDPALVRPGRFDRIVRVDLPDEAGRERILRVHASKLLGFSEGRGVDYSRPDSLGRGKRVDLSAVAAVTDGLSGAELEMVVNEAAIRAVRRVGDQLLERGRGEGVGVDDVNDLDLSEVDNTVYPEDFEASVESFFESREKEQRAKGRQMGFVID